MNYTRSQILANRQKAIEYLCKPSRRKATGVLDRGDGNRCCLGHMSFALKIQRGYGYGYGYSSAKFVYGEHGEPFEAPRELMEMIGLFDSCGAPEDASEQSLIAFNQFFNPKYRVEHDNCAESLAMVNDQFRVSPQRIGQYLLSVIEGGDTTPWRALSEYPETAVNVSTESEHVE